MTGPRRSDSPSPEEALRYACETGLGFHDGPECEKASQWAIAEIDQLRALLCNCQAHGSFSDGLGTPECHVADARKLLGLELGQTPERNRA